MRKLIFIPALLLLSLVALSQTTSDAPIFTKADSPASFPGGLEAWADYVSANLQVPKAAIEKNRGRKPRTYKVIVTFLVTKEGKIKNVSATTKFGYGLEEEAVRIIKNSPDWTPARQNGKNINYYAKQPIIFVVEDEEED